MERLYWIWISRMKYMYFEAFEILIKRYKNISNIWNANFDEIHRDDLVEDCVYKELCNEEYKKNLRAYDNFMMKNNINMVTCFDNEYPVKLHFIKNKPIVLFYKGNINIVNHETVAIVGSRNCSTYGRKCAEYFSYELARRGINIVSGLAVGIDSIAHISTLRCDGKTIAVIGNGLDNIYPSRNKMLAEKIVMHGGLVLSEFIIGTLPEKNNFPRRNRIISGISNSVIIVEGSKQSGSLITANYAINQGREVWAIPGNIFSFTSEGTNELIKDGANVLTNLDDIIRNIY